MLAYCLPLALGIKGHLMLYWDAHAWICEGSAFSACSRARRVPDIVCRGCNDSYLLTTEAHRRVMGIMYSTMKMTVLMDVSMLYAEW